MDRAHFYHTHTVPEPCSDPEAIRLTKGTTDTFGRLEVCSGGYWGTVCGIGATDAIAKVACRQLNHAATGTYMCITIAKNEQCFIFAGRLYVESNYTNKLFSVVPIARTNMMCNGNEDTLSECRYNGVDGNPDCDHKFDIFIRCTGKSYSTPSDP